MTELAGEAGIHARIAQRVRTLRAERGMSLDVLADACGVSRSMISLIERSEASPTAVVLDRIAAGLGVPLASLFDDAGARSDPLSRPRDRLIWRDPQSGYKRSNISPPNFPSPIQIVEVMLPPGARVAYETGARQPLVHQQVWVQQGAVEIRVGAVLHRLSEDDCLAFDLKEPITFHNRARQAARYVVVIAAAPRASRR